MRIGWIGVKLICDFDLCNIYRKKQTSIFTMPLIAAIFQASTIRIIFEHA